jgi:hypothetical protein
MEEMFGTSELTAKQALRASRVQQREANAASRKRSMAERRRWLQYDGGSARAAANARQVVAGQGRQDMPFKLAVEESSPRDDDGEDDDFGQQRRRSDAAPTSSEVDGDVKFEQGQLRQPASTAAASQLTSPRSAGSPRAVSAVASPRSNISTHRRANPASTNAFGASMLLDMSNIEFETSQTFNLDDDGLPTLQGSRRAKAFVSDRISVIRANPGVRAELRVGLSVHTSQLASDQELKHQRTIGKVEDFCRSRADLSEFASQFSRVNTARLEAVVTARRGMLLRDKAAADEKHADSEARLARANTARVATLESARLMRKWLLMAALGISMRAFRFSSRSKMIQFRTRYRQLLPLMAASHWYRKAMATRRARHELQKSLMFAQNVPLAVRRMKHNRYTQPATLLFTALRDIVSAKGMSSVIHDYLIQLKRAQRLTKQFLLRRKFWRAALLQAWETRVEKNMVLQFNELYPVAAGAASRKIRRTKADGDLDSIREGPVILLDAIVATMHRQRAVQSVALIEAGGPAAVGPAGIAPLPSSTQFADVVDVNGAPRVACKREHVIAFVPQSYRIAVIKELTTRAARQHSRRLIAMERYQREHTSEIFDRKPTTPPTPGSTGARRPQPDAPKARLPTLAKFVDQSSMRRLVHIVETKIAQHAVATATLAAEDDADAPSVVATAETVDEYTELTVGFASLSSLTQCRRDRPIGNLLHSSVNGVESVYFNQSQSMAPDAKEVFTSMSGIQLHEGMSYMAHSDGQPPSMARLPYDAEVAMAANMLRGLATGQAPAFDLADLGGSAQLEDRSEACDADRGDDGVALGQQPIDDEAEEEEDEEVTFVAAAQGLKAVLTDVVPPADLSFLGKFVEGY